MDFEHQHNPAMAEIPQRPAPKPVDPITDLLARKSKRTCEGVLAKPHKSICGAPLVKRPNETPMQFSRRKLCAGCQESDQTPVILRPVSLPKRRKAFPPHAHVLEPSDSLAAQPCGKNRRYSPNLDRRAAEIQAQVDQFAREA